MPTAAEVGAIVRRVSDLLANLPGQPLRVTGEKLDDGWLCIAVEPSRPGVSALDHATEMSRIERTLRGEHVRRSAARAGPGRLTSRVEHRGWNTDLVRSKRGKSV